MDEHDAGPRAELQAALDEIARLAARVAELEAERDQLIERWPGREDRCVYLDPANGKFAADDGRGRYFETRREAVRDAAGLDPYL